MVLIKVHTLLKYVSSGLQQMVSIKVHTLVIPMGSHGLHLLVTCS